MLKISYIHSLTQKIYIIKTWHGWKRQQHTQAMECYAKHIYASRSSEIITKVEQLLWNSLKAKPTTLCQQQQASGGGSLLGLAAKVD